MSKFDDLSASIGSMSCGPGPVNIIIQITPIISSYKTHMVHREAERAAMFDIETSQENPSRAGMDSNYAGKN
jgi:hypothetical protein